MNWTDDSFTRQENDRDRAVGAVAAKYTEDFDELWTTGAVEQSGWVDPAPVPLGNQKLRAWFTPGYGETLESDRHRDRAGEASGAHLLPLS